ncbi:MAG: Trk family potassium uptake protein [Clostridia bacterium]|nr:Trk family potassium uptake protein [Clostridia bacterium]
MLSDWKGPSSVDEKRSKSNRRRFASGVVAFFYRRSGFDALPIIALGFVGLILLGSLLLTLPVASATGVSVPWGDTLFTATSAVCVTGLVVRDTGTAYSTFGHVVLLFLIQMGGLGFMTFATLIFGLMGRSLSMRERMIMRESLNEDDMSGLAALVRWVAKSTFTVELAGAMLFAVRLMPAYGPAKGAFFSVFHAVSAFCNAGFDLFGGGKSLTGYTGDLLINLTAMALVVIGGLGFSTLQDVLSKRSFRRFRLHTKLVLVSYGTLLLGGALIVLVLEWSNPGTLGPLSFPDKLLASLFQSVTLRTAGFNTIDQAALRDSTKLIGGFLMLIGAAPASTGGGIKVTTLAILVLTVRMVSQGESSIVVFERRIDRELIQRTVAITFIAIAVAFVDICALSILQPGAAFLDLYYECVSAVGTVGISAIGSANLRPLARILIIITMYIGRIGPLSMALLFSRRQNRSRELARYPEDRVMIG